MAKIQIAPLSSVPEHAAAVKKLDQIRSRIAHLRSQLAGSSPEGPVAGELTVDELAEIFLEDPQAVPAAAAAPAAVSRDLAALRRDLAIAQRAAEIQGEVVAEQLAEISAKACAALEPEFLRLADAVANKLLEAARTASEARPLYDRLVAAGYRAPEWLGQPSALRVDAYALAFRDRQLDLQGMGFGIGPILRFLVASNLVPANHPAARAAKLG